MGHLLITLLSVFLFFRHVKLSTELQEINVLHTNRRACTICARTHTHTYYYMVNGNQFITKSLYHL